MEYNPYTNEVNKLTEHIARLVSQKKSITQDLTWHYNTDVESLSQESQQRTSNNQNRELQIKKIDGEVTALRNTLREIETKTKSLLNPLNWLSSEQKKYHEDSRELRNNISSLLEKKQQELNLISASNRKIENLKSNIDKYRNYDFDKNTAYLKELENSIALNQNELKKVTENKQRVDSVLNPIIAELKSLELKMQGARALLNTANQYDFELSKAANSYEKAMIHKKCESVFADGSPKKSIARQEKIINQMDRDYRKAQDRAIEVGRKASRVIDTVIIDGNNMCYESSVFVGLNPLKKVALELQKSFKIIVVFDSAIRSMLKSKNHEIEAHFPDSVKVHIVATKQYADETILNLASGNNSTYVISNDRFGDYNEKEVVKNSRLIRHEVVNNHVFIHDLNISVVYD